VGIYKTQLKKKSMHWPITWQQLFAGQSKLLKKINIFKVHTQRKRTCEKLHYAHA